jgi:hypothetical protein
MSCNWAHIPHERGGAPWRLASYACGRGWGGESAGGGEGMRDERTKINHDGIDVGLKLRSPAKIALDIGARQFDNKIKI